MRWLFRGLGALLALGIVFVAARAHQARRQAKLTAALFQALNEDEPETVARLLRQGALPTAVDDYGTPALCRAAEHDDVALVAVLLRAGARVDQRDADGGTALMRASQWGGVEVVRALIAAGAAVNTSTWHGWTSLHRAVIKDRGEVTALLIQTGADPSARRMDGLTPLQLAFSLQSSASVQLLLRAGNLVEARDQRAARALLVEPAGPRTGPRATGPEPRAGDRAIPRYVCSRHAGGAATRLNEIPVRGSRHLHPSDPSGSWGGRAPQ